MELVICDFAKLFKTVYTSTYSQRGYIRREPRTFEFHPGSLTLSCKDRLFLLSQTSLFLLINHLPITQKLYLNLGKDREAGDVTGEVTLP